MIKKISLGALIIFFFFLLSSKASAYTFERSLKLGSTGTDVLELQKFLNEYSDTQIAESGPGSPGNESTYFGSLTQEAVKNFQDKFSTDILNPAGLASSTGYVGSLTLKKINDIEVENNLSAVEEDDNSYSTSTENSDSTTTLSIPTLSNISGGEFKAGDSVTISGDKFSSDNNSGAFFASEEEGYYVWDAQVLNGKTMTFTLPSYIPAGNYNVSVFNSSGISAETFPVTVKAL